MNNKGFTLIELLATLALLAIIAVISFVSITSIVNNSKVSNCENLVKNIKTAAKEYVSDNRYSGVLNPNSDNIVTISAGVLTKNDKYLIGPLTDPFDANIELTADNINIEIKLNDDYTVKSVEIFNKIKNKIDCESGSW